MFYQIIKHGAKVKNQKLRVLHFRVENTYSKKHNWEEKVQMNAQLSFCGLGRLLFPSTLLSCSSRFLRALQQNRTQSRLLNFFKLKAD